MNVAPVLPPLSETEATHPMVYFRLDGVVYTAINASTVDSLPGIPNSDPAYSLRGRELRHAIWVTERCPELAYVLRNFDAESALLGCLQVNPKHLPIEEGEDAQGKYYFLAPDIRNAWRRLEDILVAVSTFLLAQVHGKPEAQFPLDPFWPDPMTYGYRNTHATSHLARRACAKAMDAFRALIARCSMAVALNNPNAQDAIPLWLFRLLSTDIDKAWLDMLHHSSIVDFSLGTRVGAYINPRSTGNGTRWVGHIPVMVRANVPVYIPWRMDELDDILVHHPFLKEYVPDPLKIVDVPPRRPGWEEDFVRWSTIPVRHSAPAPPDTPNIPHGPGQLPGESFEDFIARRAHKHVTLQAEASPSRMQVINARREVAATFARPTKKSGTTIYLWTTVGDIDMNVPNDWFALEYRRLVGHIAAGEVWSMYSDAQKHYDPWANEWDICAKLAPGEEQLQDEDYDDPYDDIASQISYGPAQEGAGGVPHPPTSPDAMPEPDTLPSCPHSLSAVVAPVSAPTFAAVARSFQSDLQEYYDSDDVGFAPYAASSEDAFRKRYGLTPEVVQDTDILYEAYESFALQKMTGFLGPDIPAGAPITLALSGFVERLLRDTTTPTSHDMLWDLAEYNPQYVLRAGYVHPYMELSQTQLNGYLWYRVRYNTPADRDCAWELVLKSGVALLELYRQHIVQNRMAAVLYLANRGMPFNTIFCPQRRQDVWSRPDVRTVLGWRPRGVKYTRYDYGVYEEHVRYILRGGKARAALSVGGIVWRLALEALGPRLLDEAATGPSSDVYEYATRFRPPRGDDYYDDKLSQDELDVICGVYKVVINQGQFEDLSWWPKRNSWAGSQFNLGTWTPWDEIWFVTRLSKIRAGEEQPYSTGQWKQRLKQSARAGKLRDALELASNNWLQDHYGITVTQL